MSNYRTYRYLRVTIGVTALMLLLILFLLSLPQGSYAKTTDPANLQQTGSMHPVTPTMPMGQGHKGQMMQMMGLMMQMMGHMQEMHASHMGMMHETVPMSGTAAMGRGSMMMGPAGSMTATMPMQQMHMMGQMMQAMGHRGMMECLPAATASALKADATLAQTAQLGAITVAVEPFNLPNAAAPTLDFQVTVNTHSGELNFDLRKLVTLRIGAKEIKATAWQPTRSAGRSEHHVSGTLSFPTTDAAGKPLLTDETPVVLIIRNLGGSNEQSFAWK